MQIVIDIPESKYNAIKKLKDIETSYPTTLELYKAVKEGTPLPKGHGKLIDADALEQLCTKHEIANNVFDNKPLIEQGYYEYGYTIWKPLFDFAPIILEADTGA